MKLGIYPRNQTTHTGDSELTITLSNGSYILGRCGKFSLPYSDVVARPFKTEDSREAYLRVSENRSNLIKLEEHLSDEELPIYSEISTISRYHAFLSVSEDYITLADIWSLNGISIDTRRITPGDPKFLKFTEGNERYDLILSNSLPFLHLVLMKEQSK